MTERPGLSQRVFVHVIKGIAGRGNGSLKMSCSGTLSESLIYILYKFSEKKTVKKVHKLTLLFVICE